MIDDRRVPTSSYCLARPKRDPVPPATTMVQTISAAWSDTTARVVPFARMAHEDLLAQTEFFADAPHEVLAPMLAARARAAPRSAATCCSTKATIADSLYLVLRGRLAIAIANPIDHRETWSR